MTEVFTINNEELAILCDFVGGWGAKWVTNVKTDKRRALDRLIANGFIEPAATLLQNTNTQKRRSYFSGGTAFMIGFTITPAPTRYSASPAAAPRRSSADLKGALLP